MPTARYDPSVRESRTTTGQSAKQEVDIQLQRALLTQGAGKPEAPLAARMLLWHTPHLEPFPLQHRSHGCFNLGTLGHHRVAVFRADEVHVHVHRESRRVEEEEVQRRAALERQTSLQERMSLEGLEQAEHLDGLLQHVGAKPRGRRFGEQPLPGDDHAGSSQDRSRISTGTTRFHSAARRPGFRAARSR